METFIQQLINGVALGAVYGFIAVGYSLIFGVLRVFNIAHGDVAIAAGYIGLMLAEHGVQNIWLVAGGVIVAGMVLGAILDYTCIRPVARGPWSAPLLTTLGASILLAAAMRLIFGADVRPLPINVGMGTVEIFNISIGKTYLFVIAGAIVLTVALEYTLARTTVGRWLRAVAEDPDSAQLLGIPVGRVRLGTVMASSALGGGAGLLLGLLLSGFAPSLGLSLGIKGLVVLIVGGLGSARGAMLVGVGLGVAEVMTSAYISSTYRDLVAYLALLLVLMLKPAGLFGAVNELVGERP